MIPEATELEYVVPVLAVFVIILVHVEPALVDLSILYPVICEPPLLVGALHLRFICVDDATAASPVGKDGLVGLDGMAAAVLLGDALIPADTVFLAEPPLEVKVTKCCNENVNLDRCADCIVISHCVGLTDFDDSSVTPEVVHEPETRV